MKMQEMPFNNNNILFNQFQNKYNMIQKQMNNLNNNNFNNNFNQNNIFIYNLIFNVDNIKKYPVSCFPKSKLGNIFLMLSNQIGNIQYSDMYKLKFFYNTVNITEHFWKNEEIEVLNFTTSNPVINVTST